MAKNLTRYILFALVLGVIAGWVINASIADGSPEATEQLKKIAEYLGIITTLFTAFTFTRLVVALWVRWRRPTVINL